MCPLLCAFLPSKPPEGTAWPSRCEQGSCPEGPAGQGLWTVLVARQGGQQEARWVLLAFSPVDGPLAQPPCTCRGGGQGPYPDQLPRY